MSHSQLPSTTASSRPTSSGNDVHASPDLKGSAISSSTTSLTNLNLIQTPRKDSSLQPSPSVSHRSSFADNLRDHPRSPRAQRQPSFSGVALQELLMNPLKLNGSDGRFQGRDWRDVQVAEIIEPAEVRFVELETNVEETTKLLIKSGAPNVVLVRESVKTKTAIGTFDYSDLNAYLLIVLGLAEPDEAAQRLALRARSREDIPMRDILHHLGARELPAFIPHTADLTKAMEVLGGGAHRLIVCKEGTSEVVGMLTQLRLVRFFWENHLNFTAVEQLYAHSLKELELGEKAVLAINGDKPLSDALLLMHNEGVTSLPVLDHNKNVVGNISHVDVRLLTDTSAIPLLSSSCIHFISVILSERGMNDGKDSYPVFYVSHFSTLAHTVAKLCATRSHRMWIVEAPSSAGSSVPPSPGPHAVPPPLTGSLHSSTGSLPGRAEPTQGPPYTSTNPGVAVSAAQLPGENISGHLSGVVSLTDVLNLFARASGLSPSDPEEQRQKRRRSSSSSLRPSMDNIRPSGEYVRGSVDLGRSPSAAGGRRAH